MDEEIHKEYTGVSKKRNVGGIQETYCESTAERMEQIFDYFTKEIGLVVRVSGVV